MNEYDYPKQSTAMGSLSRTTEPEAQEMAPRVSRLAGNVQKAIAVNMEIAAQLEQRLHAVLLPCGPSGSAQDKQAAKPVISPLASDLETFEAQLYALSAHYTDILNRLEI